MLSPDNYSLFSVSRANIVTSVALATAIITFILIEQRGSNRVDIVWITAVVEKSITLNKATEVAEYFAS